MNQSYSRPYGIGLVDDLHNFFPAILYTPEMFNTTQDLLQYFSHQVREHFNIYNRNMRQFVNQNNTSPPVPTQFVTTFGRNPPQPRRITPPPPQIRRRDQTRAPIRIQTREQHAERPEITTTRIRYTTAPVSIPMFDQMEEESNLGSSLSALFSLLRPSVDLGNLMEPVVVRPTAQQIDTATTKRQANNETTICSICQEPYTSEDSLQIIKHCQHSFHSGCLSRWFEENTRCPVCRWDIREITPAEQPGQSTE